MKSKKPDWATLAVRDIFAKHGIKNESLCDEMAERLRLTRKRGLESAASQLEIKLLDGTESNRVRKEAAETLRYSIPFLVRVEQNG